MMRDQDEQRGPHRRAVAPRLGTRLLRRCVAEDELSDLLGDLEEVFRARARRDGPTKARRWYVGQVLQLCVRMLVARLRDLWSRPRQGRSGRTPRRDEYADRSTIGILPGALLQDVQFAVRALRRGRGIVAVAIVTLGIGIGANATVFSAIEALLLRPMPYPQSDRLDVIWLTDPDRGPGFRVLYSVLDFVDLRERSRTMHVAATQSASFNLSGSHTPERLRGSVVSSNIFEVLGVQPELGRGFAPEEEQPGRSQVAVFSHGLWQRQYGSDPNVLGSTVLLDGTPYTMVGVMPGGFWFRYPRVDVWVPLAISGAESRHSQGLSLVGRLKAGTTTQQAQQEAQLFAAQMAAEYPETNDHCPSAVLESLHDDVYGSDIRAACLIAFVAAGVVLLVVCANVANLLLTFVSGRAREVALRSALGANRWRIVRQLLTEAILVSLGGGLLGIGLAILDTRMLQSVIPLSVPRVTEIGINASVLLYTGALSVFSGVLAGILPAFRSSEANTIGMLNQSAHSGTGVSRARIRKALVGGEVSLTFALLVAMALLVQGFARIRLADRGFDESDVLTFEITLPVNDYPDTATVAAFHADVRARLAAIPGVDAVGATNALPLELGNTTAYVLPGEDITDETQRRPVYRNRVVPGYFAAMDVPILSGRDVEDRDRADTRRVVLIDETIAQRHWPNADPVGRRLELVWGPHEIIGVVADIRDRALAAANSRPNLYLSAYQSLWRTMSWVVESSLPPERVAEAIRNEIRSLDGDLPVYNVRSLDALIDESLGDETISVKILGALAFVALLLALSGVYSVVAYGVSRRARELGIRVALGADSRTVLALAMRQGTIPVLIGMVAGVGMAVAVARVLPRFLFGVSPIDPASYAVAATTLLVTALAATYIPARRATHVTPLTALRVE